MRRICTVMDGAARDAPSAHGIFRRGQQAACAAALAGRCGQKQKLGKSDADGAEPEKRKQAPDRKPDQMIVLACGNANQFAAPLVLGKSLQIGIGLKGRNADLFVIFKQKSREILLPPQMIQRNTRNR